MDTNKHYQIFTLIIATLLVVTAYCLGSLVTNLQLNAVASSSWPANWWGWGVGCVVIIAGLLVLQHRLSSRVRRQENDELRRLAIVAERTTNGVCITDKAKSILWANEGFTRITGYTLAEVQGQVPGHVLQCKRTNPATIKQIRSALRNGHGFHGEILNRDKEGNEYWIELEIQAIRNDNYEITGFMGIQNDITERVEAERSARELAKIVDEAPQVFYLVDVESLQLVVVNNGACKALGYTRDELLSVTALDITPELSEEAFRSKIALLAKPSATQNSQCFETTHRRQDGTTFSAHVTMHSAEYDGRPVCACFTKDLTEWQHLEQQLAEARKLKAIGQLAAGISHEINSPMQCLVHNIEYLSDSLSQLLTVTDGYREAMDLPVEDWESRRARMRLVEQEQRYESIRCNSIDAIQESSEAAQRVVEVVRAMKTMSHPGTKEKSDLDINTLIRDAATITRNQWKYCATLDLQLDESLPSVPLLANAINQVLINLIINAADAITEKAEHQQSHELGRIEIATWHESDGINIRIHDTGCGMTEEATQRAFEPFYTTKAVGKGTGQGLAISYDIIVNKHGGTIEIESEPGQGTAFVIWLPNPSVGESQGDEIETQGFGFVSDLEDLSGQLLHNCDSL